MAKTSKTKSPIKRAAGRPYESGSVGKSALVDAAIELLRVRSPQQLTVVEVASRANVDPALIRYYFGNKKGLLLAATEHLMDQVQRKSEIMFAQEAPLAERVRLRLNLLLEVLQENPRFFQLVMEEIYGAPEKQGNFMAIAERGLALSKAMLEAGPTDPPLHPTDPRLLHVATLGMCTFFMDAKPLLAALYGNEMDEAAYTKAYVDFATDFIVRGLTKMPVKKGRG